MKENIHPQYKDVKVTCSCGSVFTTRSTMEKDTLLLEVCSACHPFYTGTQKMVDTAGRVDRFRQKYGMKGKDTTPVADTQPATAKVEAKPEAATAKAEAKKAEPKKAEAKKAKKADKE